jgi:cobyric acid synthase
VSALVSLLCERTGVPDEGSPELGFAEYKESQYDALADAVEAALDMDKLMSIIEEGICNE